MMPSLAAMLLAPRKDEPIRTRTKRAYKLQNPRKPIGEGHRARSVEAKRLERLNPPTEQICIQCGELQPIANFRTTRRTKSPHIKTCKICEEK